jgi:hypothetical protein
MDNEQLQELLRFARAAVARGVSNIEVNRRIQALTGGQFVGIMDLTLAVDPMVKAEEAEAEKLKEFEKLHSLDGKIPAEIGAFLASLGQGATFGFADELVRPEQRDAVRRATELRRELNPGATFAGELAGTFASPITGLLGRGFNLIRGAGGFLRTVAAGGATGATGGAVFSAGEAEGDLVERAGPAAVGGAAGGAFGAGMGGTAAIAGLLGRHIAPSRSLARRQMGRMVEQAGVEDPSQLPGAVRSAEQASGLPRGTGTLMDVDPAISRRAPGIARQAPDLHSAEGPIRSFTTRVSPQQLQSARRAIWRPLEARNQSIKDRALLNFFRRDPVAQDALRRVIGQRSADVRELTFRELQSARRFISRALSRDIDPVSAESMSKALTKLDDMLETKVPGFREANAKYREMLSRQQGMEAVNNALDQAFPQFNAGLPNTLEGATATMKNAVLDIPRRREAVAEMVGELILEPGGIEKVQRLLREGFFRKLARAGVSLGRQTGQTEVGRLFGSTVTTPADEIPTVRLGIEFDPETGATTPSRGGLLDPGS